ncbi:hypothetical protein E0I26_07330 [Flavobacterium rhamnosiphilum]|uniref:Methyltransferase domain-containing protein n=1 Tax=Flavobacterium rhamnosiphilum TaxID=2541724 RepID=A0A4R5FA10_9FLAO|nr:hypothetical protein [Flavobacterium rhamnosiphilum]TDE44942.1 hypothetical protein E0I26_07330 [Flavobacterium rhamnosiphilum]
MKARDDFKRKPNLNYEEYDTDKIPSNYLDRYDPILEPWIGKKITLLELGILKGGSLQLWHDYFPFSKIVGIDLNLPEKFKPVENIYMYKGSQADTKFLSEVANEIAPDGYDIIIDDASHIGELTKIAFWHLFDNHLKPGGLYAIEDWGTGYWNDWPDGKSLDYNIFSQPPSKVSHFCVRLSQKIRRGLLKFTPNFITRKLPVLSATMPCHSYGMVGFIKQLVDEQAASDVTRKNLSGKAERDSKFKKIIITPSIVFIIKADDHIN